MDVEPIEKDVVIALDALTDVLNQQAIAYAVIGGLGMLFRSRLRFTQDVDVLTTHQGKLDLKLIQETWQPHAENYPAATKWFEGMLLKYAT